MAKNIHNVPKKQWTIWGKVGQATFNRNYKALMLARHVLFHPSVPLMSISQFRTVAWNASWLAADEAVKLFKERMIYG